MDNLLEGLNEFSGGGSDGLWIGAGILVLIIVIWAMWYYWWKE